MGEQGTQVVGRATERNKQLGGALRQARKAAGFNQDAAAKELEYSQPTINRIESGSRVPTPAELKVLVTFYNPAQDLRDEIEWLATLPDVPGLGGMSPNENFVKMLQAAESALEIFTFHSERTPMPLQSDQYALLQYELVEASINKVTVLRAWEDRRRIITGDSPPRYRAILAQSSLLRMPDGRTGLIKQQAQYILNLIDNYPRFTLQILHPEAKLAYVDTDFTALRMPGKQKDLVYIPYGLDGTLLKDKWQVDERLRYWHHAQRAALSEDNSRKLIHDLASYGRTP